MWESKMDIYNVFELRCKTTCYFGVGAIKKISDILDNLKAQGIDNVIFVTDKIAYKVTGAWDVIEPELKAKGFKYVIYEDVSPNPTTAQINEATKLGLQNGAQAVIGIGGGSPIDTAKSVAILLEYPEKNC